jgi:hypothetical protein
MRIARWLPALLMLVVSSCGSSQTTRTNVDQFVNWPNQFSNFRFHWYAAPGIELTMPAPQINVLGRWFISAASGSLWGPSGHGVRVASPELQQQCLDRMPDNAAARQAMSTGLHDQPPPHGNPTPGWPANPQ